MPFAIQVQTKLGLSSKESASHQGTKLGHLWSIRKFSTVKSTVKKAAEDSLNIAKKDNKAKVKQPPSRVPRGFWTNEGNQRNHLDRIGSELGVKQMDDWYNISAKQVRNKASFICYYGSLFEALKKLYPEHEWDPLRFKVPQGYWIDEDNQREHLDRIGRELGVKQMDDWYNISAEQVRNRASFVGYYGSLFDALQKLYPEHKWDSLRFNVPPGHWTDENNQRKHLDKIGRELGVKQMDDWYNIPAEKVRSKASFICNYHKDSLFHALEKLYPEHKWDPLRFSRVPQAFWTNENNQRKHLDKIGKELGVKQMEDWYNISAEQVRRKAKFICYYFHDSLFRALEKLYPEFKWDPLRFSTVPRGFWLKESTKKQFHELLIKWKQKYKIEQLKDWYNLPPKKVKLFRRVAQGIFGSITKMLVEWFPTTNWSAAVQASTPELDLQWMMQLVADIKVHPKIGEYSVDVFIPDWKVAIEYQGGQHFQQSWRGDLQSQMKRDKEKQQFFQQEEISLIPINHHWNGTWSQLRATIMHARPDLLPLQLESDDSVPNCFPENITLEEVTNAIKQQKFFKKIDWDSFITFDYDNSHFPMFEYRKAFKDPNTAPDEQTKRLWQIFRGIKFSRTGELLCRPFHKFFDLNEVSEVKESTIDIKNVECILEKYDGKMIAPVKINGNVKFLTRGGADVALNKYSSSTNVEAFAEHIISKNQTPIFEFVSKNQQVIINYKENSVILLAIRDNVTGHYKSYHKLKEEAAPFDVLVAREWPRPMNLKKLINLEQDLTGIEGFVIKLHNGTLIKWKTDWWRKQRQLRRKFIIPR